MAALFLLPALVLPLVALAPGALPSQGAAPQPAPVAAPLEVGLTTSAGSWAVVPMGQLGTPLNTFWELFFRATGATRWTLTTPAGVADNGGLAVSAPASGGVGVGFLPSQLLKFSPLALSENNGSTWSPALVPSSLVAVPDALATQGATGSALALVQRRGTQVLSSVAGLLKWSSVAGRGDLAAGANRVCDIGGLQAVAFGPNAVPMVGAQCRRPGVVGVFSEVAGRWRLSGPVLNGPLAHATATVVRLNSSAGLPVALIATSGAGRRTLIAAWGSAGGTWSESQPLGIKENQRVASSAVGATGDQAVLLAAPGSRDALAVSLGPDQAWNQLPPPPLDTVTVALSADGSVDAFAVNGAVLSVFTLGQGQSTWRLAQKLRVPLSYGSS